MANLNSGETNPEWEPGQIIETNNTQTQSPRSINSYPQKNIKPGHYCCISHPWVFIVFGVALIIIGFLLAVIYFIIRTLTTSLEHTETIPTYANAIIVICAGVLVILLSKRRNKIIIFAVFILCSVCVVLCIVSGLLTGLDAIKTLRTFIHCTYNGEHSRCHCFKSAVNKTVSQPDQVEEMIFHNSPSCSVISRDLLDLMYTACGLYASAVVLAIICVLLGILAYRQEKELKNYYEDEFYFPSNNQVCQENESNEIQEGCDNAALVREHNPPARTRQPVRRTTSQIFGRGITLPGAPNLHTLGVRRSESFVSDSRGPINETITGEARRVTQRNAQNRNQRFNSNRNQRNNQNYNQTPSSIQTRNIQDNSSHQCNHCVSTTGGQNQSNISSTNQPNISSIYPGWFYGGMVPGVCSGACRCNQTSISNGGGRPVQRSMSSAAALPHRPMHRSRNPRDALPPRPISRSANPSAHPPVACGSTQLENVQQSTQNDSARCTRRRTVDSFPQVVQHCSGNRCAHMNTQSNCPHYQFAWAPVLCPVVIEPPPPYSDPPPYIENDLVPDYISVYEGPETPRGEEQGIESPEQGRNFSRETSPSSCSDASYCHYASVTSARLERNPENFNIRQDCEHHRRDVSITVI